MLGEGKGMAEIATRINVSIKTVETYRARIKQTLNIKSRSLLIALAVESRLLQPSTNGDLTKYSFPGLCTTQLAHDYRTLPMDELPVAPTTAELIDRARQAHGDAAQILDDWLTIRRKLLQHEANEAVAETDAVVQAMWQKAVEMRTTLHKSDRLAARQQVS